MNRGCSHFALPRRLDMLGVTETASLKIADKELPADLHQKDGQLCGGGFLQIGGVGGSPPLPSTHNPANPPLPSEIEGSGVCFML